MGDPVPAYAEIVAAFAGTGLAVRGGFATDDGGGMPPMPGGERPRAVVLIGTVSGRMWRTFHAARLDEPHPLDAWTKRSVEPIATRLGAVAVYPNDKPYQPFQQWAMRAEPVQPSPLGILIHPEHGLWHAYRAALLLADVPAGLPARESRPSPCASCLDKPCLQACPVTAFTNAGFAVDRCAEHLRSGDEPHCMELGCRARAACPAGRALVYGREQLQFHMQAFLAARGQA